MKILKNKLFRLMVRFLWRAHRWLMKLINIKGDHYCPVCESNVRRFDPYGTPKRPNARCPVCRSLERHRLDWMFFKKRTNLLDGKKKKLLHVAPERFMSDKFIGISNLDYLSAGLSGPHIMVKMDITDIEYPENSFDIIYCSHVLEHIVDDRKAIAELYRVLKIDGWAVLQVPVTAAKTYEDSSIIEPKDRLKHFGQKDHVRCCGPDYIDRMKAAGFAAQTVCAADLLAETDRERMGIRSKDVVFFCQKPAS